MRWFTRRVPKKSVPIEVKTIESTKLRLVDWQGEKTLVGSASKVFSDPDFRLMMQVAYNEHPAFTVFNPNVPEHVRTAHQAKAEGYTMALANLEAMTKFKRVVNLEEPTFEPEEKQ